MKLKQRLVILLGTAILVTSMPVVTMGASVNTITKIVVSGNAGTPLGDKAPELVLNLKDGWSDSDFYLTLDNSEWEDNVSTTPQVYGIVNGVQVPIANFELLSSKEARIQKKPEYQGYINEVEKIRILLNNVVLKGGDASVFIDGADSEITSGKLIFGTVVQDKARVDINLNHKEYEIYEQGKIAEIRVSEMYAGQLCESSNSEDRIIRIEIDNPSIEFVEPKEENIILERGLSGLEDIQIRYGKNTNGEENRQVIEVELPYVNTYVRGNIIFRGLEVINKAVCNENHLYAVVDGNRVEAVAAKVATIKDIRDMEEIRFKDANLKKSLINQGMDFDNNGEITREEMKRILILDFRNCDIKDITGLEYAVNLKELWLWENEIENIEVLSQLKSLEILNLDFNKVKDIAPLAKLDNLKQLHLGYNQIQDISVIRNLKSLEILDLTCNGIENIDVLKDLISLKTLFVPGNNISSIDILKNFNHLENLSLVDNPIKDISILEEIPSLIKLRLINCEIEDIKPLAKLVNLKQLYLDKNNIVDISYLPEIKYDRLILQYNYLDIESDSESMQKISKLIELGGNVEYSPQYEKAKSSNANLSNLTVDKGILSPAFNGNVMNYSIAVGSEVESIKVDAISEDVKAIIIGAGEKALKVGVNSFEILVTAEDGVTTKTYTVVVTRAELSKQPTGGSGGGGGGTIKPPTLEQAIEKLKVEDKQILVKNFKENVPYTTVDKVLTLEQLKVLTNNLFIDKQLQEMIENPEVLKVLGIDLTTLNTKVTLITIKDASFTDVSENHWANKSIKKASELGLIAGMPDGTFVPNASLQVADTFTFLDRVLLLNGINDMKLSRSVVEKYITNKEHWAFANMASIGSKLREETLQEVSKVGESSVSRELLAQVLYEVTDGKLPQVNKNIEFEDVQGSFYEKAIDYCIKTGLLNGIGEDKMSPEKSLTRAELMTVLIRLNEAIN